MGFILGPSFGRGFLAPSLSVIWCSTKDSFFEGPLEVTLALIVAVVVVVVVVVNTDSLADKGDAGGEKDEGVLGPMPSEAGSSFAAVIAVRSSVVFVAACKPE